MGLGKKNLELFGTKDYRKALRCLVEKRQLVDRAYTFQNLSELTRISKSYISKVMSGTANLSSDQAYSIGKVLGLSGPELTYFLLLLERERSALEERQKELDLEILRIQEKHLQTKEHLSDAGLKELNSDYFLYYTTPWAQVVHIGLTIPHFARDPQSLCTTLKMNKEDFLQTLHILERLKLVTPETNGYSVSFAKTHLTPDSPQHRSWRLQQDALTNAAFLERRDPKHYGYSVTYSATESVRAEIRRRFLDFLQDVQRLAGDSKPEKLFQMRFDLFSWTPDEKG